MSHSRVICPFHITFGARALAVALAREYSGGGRGLLRASATLVYTLSHTPATLLDTHSHTPSHFATTLVDTHSHESCTSMYMSHATYECIAYGCITYE